MPENPLLLGFETLSYSIGVSVLQRVRSPNAPISGKLTEEADE